MSAYSSSSSVVGDAENESVHPAYNDHRADIVLRSSDGKLFKVHSVLLRLASDFFADMFSLPQNPTETSEPVQLAETTDIIRSLLDFIYPRRPLPKLHTFSFVSRLAGAADKYDIVDVTRYIRERLTSVDTLSGSALEQYALACRFRWDHEASYIARSITPPNTQSTAERAILEKLDAVSIVKLLDLHQRRRSMIASLTISYHPNALAETRARQMNWEVLKSDQHLLCRSQAHDRSAWYAFKLAALMQLESMSPNDCLAGMRPGFWDESKPSGLWEDECSKCKERFFSKNRFAEEFERILLLLPTTID